MATPPLQPQPGRPEGGPRWLPLATIAVAVLCAVVLPVTHHVGEVVPMLFMILIALLGLAGAWVSVVQDRKPLAVANLAAGAFLVPLVLAASALLS